MKKIFYALLTSLFLISCYAQQENILKKNNVTNPEIEQKVADLLDQMTLGEKISQMSFDSPAIPHLNIPAYNWWNECLHGVARAGYATVFPQAIGLAATWNSDLILEVADAISTEARAKYHEAVRNEDREIYKGLTFWTPNINIFRDPRWGRGQETYGEDPYLTSRIGVAFIKGLQGNDPNYFKVIATPKHFAVHSGPEPDRHTFNAVINSRDLYDTYLPAFEACIKEGNAFSIMCAYNRFMGEACCGSPLLLQNILRDDWGFDGYIVSDCGAINDIYANHKIVKTSAEAAAVAVKAGTDLNCGGIYTQSLMEAVESGLLSESDIDKAVARLLTARFKLGMFDAPENVKYSQIPFSENDSDKHRQLALKTAHESIVLLKNNNNVLPLGEDIKKIAVIGPTADSYQMLLGNYSGTPSKYVTLLKGIINTASEKNIKVEYEKGCNTVEAGQLKNYLTGNDVKYEGQPGLKAEFFKNTDLSGEPYFTKIDRLDNPNLIYGTRQPNIRNEKEYSIRWSGKLNIKESGKYNFMVKGADGFRLFVDDNLLIDQWQEHNVVIDSGTIFLDVNKTHNLRLEYFRKQARALLTVQWELLNVDNIKRAVNIASSSDVVVFIGGISPLLEGEEMEVDLEGFKGGDRTSLQLPKVQGKLLKSLYATGKPIVLVLTSGSALAVNWADKNIPSILEVWYPGEEGGTALADVLFGKYNPAGRLPVTFYKSVDQLPPFEDYSMKERTYRYFEEQPLYSFGYGMTYSKFEYSNISEPFSSSGLDSVILSIEVKNTGKLDGDEVVQLYIKDLESSVPVPIHSLQGLKRVHLKAGEKRKIYFTISPKQLSIVDKNNNRVVEPGMFELTIGGCQPGIKCETTGNLTTLLEVKGNAVIVE